MLHCAICHLKQDTHYGLGGASVLKAAGRRTKSSPSWAKPITRWTVDQTSHPPAALTHTNTLLLLFSSPVPLVLHVHVRARSGLFPAASSLQTRVSHFPSCSSAESGRDQPSAPLYRRPRPGGSLNEAYWQETGGQSSCFDKSSLAFINHLVLRGVKDL